MSITNYIAVLITAFILTGCGADPVNTINDTNNFDAQENLELVQQRSVPDLGLITDPCQAEGILDDREEDPCPPDDLECKKCLAPISLR